MVLLCYCVSELKSVCVLLWTSDQRIKSMSQELYVMFPKKRERKHNLKNLTHVFVYDGFSDILVERRVKQILVNIRLEGES